jgi:hypothetical protein
MANPNIVNVSSILGETGGLDLTDTNSTVLLSNAASSGNIMKVNFVSACNDSASSANVTLTWTTGADGGGTGYKIVDNLAITANTSLVILDRASSLYLKEANSLTATASAGNAFHVVVSYEIIS